MREKSFVALRYRDFRLLWFGQLISVAGSQMQSAAILWQIYAITHSPLDLGLMGLTRLLPMIGFGLLSGLMADAMDRRRLMLITQSGMAAAATVLAGLTFRGLQSVWPIYLLAALSAAFGTFDTPARQSLIPNLVSREHLTNAYSLNTTVFQLGAVVGPSLAGVAIASAGLGWVYLINALSFLAVIGALVAMRPVAPGRISRQVISLAGALEGLRFVMGAPLIRSTMLLDFFVTFFASATTLLPVFAQTILHVGPQGYGLLYAAPSLGAVVAGLAVSLHGTLRRQGPVLLASVAVYGAATVLFGLSPWFGLTFCALAISGMADTVSAVIRGTLRQLQTPDELRGRMTSWNMIFFNGGPQLGELEAGLVAHWLGAVISVVLGGVGSLAVTSWVAASTPEIRRYRGEELPAGQEDLPHAQVRIQSPAP